MNYKMISECGDRKINEDCAGIAVYDTLHCFVLCDGLGGHSKGQQASQMAVQSFLEYFKNYPSAEPQNIAQAFEITQQKLLAEQAVLQKNTALKTTAVLLLTNEKYVVWAHIGDSRLYVFHWNRIAVQTADHSVPQMLAEVGEIKKNQIRSHPDRNRLLRVLGTEWNAQKYEISKFRKIGKCQAFLLCSDGFWEFIEEKEMCAMLKKSHSAEEWLQLMLTEIKKNAAGKEMDNYTAIAVFL